MVDCRVPTKENTALGEPFVTVALEQGAEKLSADDLVAEHGQPNSYRPAPPQHPGSSGTYVYKAGPRSLWLSLSREVPARVLEISIHAGEDTP